MIPKPRSKATARAMIAIAITIAIAMAWRRRVVARRGKNEAARELMADLRLTFGR